MKATIRNSLSGLIFLSASISVFAQCDVLNRVSPDGSMQYYMKPVNFYWTKAMSLQGCIVTDKENYFLELLPLPFPEKPEGRKLKNNLKITLSDGNSYELDHYDTRYIQDDTVLQMLFLIGKKDLDNLVNFEVADVKIDMSDSTGIRSYVFQLHKSALKEQLGCFLKDDEEKKKK
jgi:hypothetical protein